MSRLFLLGICICYGIGWAAEEQAPSPFFGQEGKEMEEEELIVFDGEELEEDGEDEF